MIGEFVIIGDACYLRTNKKGTLEKLPKLKWYYVFYFAFKSAFFGPVNISEIRKKAAKSSRVKA